MTYSLTTRANRSNPTISFGKTNHSSCLSSLRDLVARRLQVHLPVAEAPTQPVASAMHYAVEGGHRWRPLLLITTYEGLTFRDGLEVIDAACSIELVHCCTIILDDLPCVDNADVRRGKPTCHKVYGEAVTIYSSHLLYALAERLALENARRLGLAESPIQSHFYELRQRLIDGQVLESNLNRGLAPADDASLSRLYELKASLFSSAMWLGGTFANQDGDTIERLWEYGRYLGMAYQVADDIADLTGNPEEMGKPTGADGGKVNFVTAAGLERAQSLLETYWQRATSSLQYLSGNVQLAVKVGASVLGVAR